MPVLGVLSLLNRYPPRLPALVVCWLTAWTLSATQPPKGLVVEDLLRKLAIKKVEPQYVAGCLKSVPWGVVVAELQVDTRGAVTKCTVLESPSNQAAASVSAAVSRWTFRPLRGNDNVPFIAIGRLTFYFVRTPAGGVVLNPSQAKEIVPKRSFVGVH